MPQRNHAGAGQGSYVDNRFRFETLNVGQHVAQHQTAFGVGVQHFNGLAGHGSQHITRAISAAAGMFSQPASTPITLMGN